MRHVFVSPLSLSIIQENLPFSFDFQTARDLLRSQLKKHTSPTCFTSSSTDQTLNPVSTTRKRERRYIVGTGSNSYAASSDYRPINLQTVIVVYVYIEDCAQSRKTRLFLHNQLVSWCFEPSQPRRITSGLETNVNPSPTYPAFDLTTRWYTILTTGMHSDRSPIPAFR